MRNLKQITLLILVAACFLGSCKKTKKDTDAPSTSACPSCATTPEAVAANNTSAKGIYIGVVVGSTGTIKFDIANNGTAIKATMVIDGVTVNFTTTTVFVSGQAFRGVFTGTLSGVSATITFSVDADGKNASVTATSIPGHTGATFLLSKETSTSLIEAYVGTYSSTKPETGTFDMLISRSEGIWSVIARENGSSEIHIESGTIVAGKLLDVDGKAIATLTTDKVSGTFNGGGDNTEITTVNGVRSL